MSQTAALIARAAVLPGGPVPAGAILSSMPPSLASVTRHGLQKLIKIWFSMPLLIASPPRHSFVGLRSHPARPLPTRRERLETWINWIL